MTDTPSLRNYAEKLIAAIDDHDEANVWGWSRALRAALAAPVSPEPPALDYEGIRTAIRTVLERRRAVVSIPDGTLAWDALAVDVWSELATPASEEAGK